MTEPCFLCQRIAEIKAGTNPFFVTELNASYVVLGDFQAWRGYTLVLSKSCKGELHELEPTVRRQFLDDMALVAEAVHRVFKPAKLNYEMLGNQVRHMHWHIFPRSADEPDRLSPVWARYATAKDDARYKLTREDVGTLVTSLRDAIERLR